MKHMPTPGVYAVLKEFERVKPFKLICGFKNVELLFSGLPLITLLVLHLLP